MLKSSLSVVAAALALVAVGGMAAPMVDPPTVDLKAASPLTAVVDGLRDERVVYVGEIHTAYEDHLVQLAVVQALHERDPDVAIGVEWFQQPYQEHLDQYIAGTLDEGQMLERTEYFSRWGFDYRLYRPIMRYAREHGIPVLALNAPTEVTRAVGDLGLDAVADDLKELMPRSYGDISPAYEARLREVYDTHPDQSTSFERFVDVQRTWDESMAERTADYLEAHPDRRVVVLAGRGHVGHGAGIPAGVARRTGIAGTTVLVAHGDGEERSIADYLVLASPRDLPPSGLMGVLLDSTGDDTVTVMGVSEGGGASAAGIQEDDVIVAIDGQAIRDYADVKLALLEKAPGDVVTVSIRREGLLFDAKESRLEVELQARPMSPHGAPR